MPWTHESSDPNSAEAVAYRDRQLKAAEHLHAQDRKRFMAGLAAGKRVLSLGCVDHDFDLRTDWWLHDILATTAAELIGVDYDAVGIEKMRAAGYDVIQADITEDISAVLAHGPFDVVVAGEIIEHVRDPQSVLDIASGLLAPGGQLLITTPNPYAPWRVRAGQRGLSWENVDHVVYCFPAGIAEMADRSGMRLVAFGSLNITGRSDSLRASVKEWARHKKHGQALSPVWVSPLDALVMKIRGGFMLAETAVYLLEPS